MQFFRSWQRPLALSFDLDDTLYDNRPHIEKATRWMADTLADEIGKRVNWQGYKDRVLAARPELTHDVTECRRSWLSLGLKEQGIQAYQQRADELMDEFIAVRSDFVVPQASHQLLAKLCEKYPLVAMTNGNVDIERIGLKDYFSHIFYAGGVYRSKPFGDLFDAAAESLNLPRERIAHIGDHPITDVYGAVSNGYQAVWLNDRGAFEPLVLPHLALTQLDELALL